MHHAAALLFLALAPSPLVDPDPAVSHDYYPTAIGDRWTYESSMRGRFTNEVVDTVRIDDGVYYRVASTDAAGDARYFHVRHEAGRVYHRVGTSPETLFMDFTVGAGGSFRTSADRSGSTVTFTAEHDTLTVLGTPYRHVRVYRTTAPGGPFDVYFARGIGIVGNVSAGGSGLRSRLVEARVAGADISAAAEPPGGTGIAARALSPGQVDALALLGKVWGFVKYHHPAVTGGDVDWDAALFDIAPDVIDAGSHDNARPVLAEWLASLGDPAPCAPCAELPGDLHLEPEIDWIEDAAVLGQELSDRLVRVYRNRSVTERQRYVSHAPGIGNPVFDGEDPFIEASDPDAGHRLLGLFRYWNIIRYWFPYRDLIEDDWDAVLREFIPRVSAELEADAYALAMLELAARTHDTHASIPRAQLLRPPRGGAQLPVVLRFVEGHAVVTGFSNEDLGPATGLRPGDAITHLDGEPVDSLIAAWSLWHPASNEPARLRSIARTLTRGDAGPVRVAGLRDGAPFQLTAQREPVSRLDPRAGQTHDLPGETFRMLDSAVAYLKLSTIVAADIAGYLQQARDAAVLVVDIRNYPSEFVPFALGGRLIAEPTAFARFTAGDARNPGAFRWTPPVVMRPLPPVRFDGAVVVLVDESSISQSEYTAMALRATPNAIVVGSTTAGADGNISRIPLPGGLEAIITGIGVFYPDRTPTQRIGIIPDLEARPTIPGIRDGRDEVLEAGVSHALGREFRLRR
jgi:C-terminal processing protease CtpA/Prc